MSNCSSERSDKVSVEAEASSSLRELALPAVPGERVAAAISRAARRAGMSFSRARDVWYGNARAILATEMDQLRERAAEAREKQADVLRGRNEELTSRLERLETTLDGLRRRLESSRVDGEG